MLLWMDLLGVLSDSGVGLGLTGLQRPGLVSVGEDNQPASLAEPGNSYCVHMMAEFQQIQEKQTDLPRDAQAGPQGGMTPGGTPCAVLYVNGAS